MVEQLVALPDSRLTNLPPQNNSWQISAACHRSNTDIFFPVQIGKGKAAEEKHDVKQAAAKIICFTCPVISPCFDYASDTGQVGVWGGATEKERDNLGKLYSLFSLYKTTDIAKMSILPPANDLPISGVIFDPYTKPPQSTENNKPPRRSNVRLEITRLIVIELKNIGWTNKQIAERMGVKPGYIKGVVKRLIQAGRLTPGQFERELKEKTDRQVLKLRKAGKTNEQIAVELNLSEDRLRNTNSRLLIARKIKEKDIIRYRLNAVDRQVLELRTSGKKLTNAEIAEIIGVPYGTVIRSNRRLIDLQLITKRKSGRRRKITQNP